MTAVVAAAADALDLTGDRLLADAAPADVGVLFLPEPVYHRRPDGTVAGIGALTWAKFTARGTGHAGWAVCGWIDRTDPHDPAAARTQAQLAREPLLASRLGPYILSDFDHVPIGRPIDPRPDLPITDEADTDWQPAPDGRYCLDEAAARTSVCTTLAYAFWRISAQPLATVAHPPLDRAAAAAPPAPASCTTPASSCSAASPPSPNPLAGKRNGATGSGSSCAATGAGSATRTATPTGSGSTPTSKDPTAPRCWPARKSPSSPADPPTRHRPPQRYRTPPLAGVHIGGGGPEHQHARDRYLAVREATEHVDEQPTVGEQVEPGVRARPEHPGPAGHPTAWALTHAPIAATDEQAGVVWLAEGPQRAYLPDTARHAPAEAGDPRWTYHT